MFVWGPVCWNAVAMFWFVTDSSRPAATTREVVSALAAQAGVVVLFRDKRPDWDRRLLADVARIAPRFVVNVGVESAAVAASFGALGWHAPEDRWRDLASAPAGLVSVSDHDGDGLRFAQAQAVPIALVSPIWIEKGRSARGPAAFDETCDVLQIALGGVRSRHDSELAMASGAAGVAVQRAAYEARDPQALAVELLAPFGASRHARRVATLLSD